MSYTSLFTSFTTTEARVVHLLKYTSGSANAQVNGHTEAALATCWRPLIAVLACFRKQLWPQVHNFAQPSGTVADMFSDGHRGMKSCSSGWTDSGVAWNRQLPLHLIED